MREDIQVLGTTALYAAKKIVCAVVFWTQRLREAPALTREAPSIGSRADSSFGSEEHSLLA